MMASFLVALASAAWSCGFHVKLVSRVTPRNVGVSICGTGWLFNLSETFSFAVDSVKSVLTVLVVLSCSAQLSVQLHTSLMVFWIRWTAVVVCSSAEVKLWKHPPMFWQISHFWFPSPFSPYPSLCVSLHLCQSVCLCVCLFVCLSVSLSVSLISVSFALPAIMQFYVLYMAD